jgi:hypothetical protein
MAINPKRARSPGQEGHVVRFGKTRGHNAIEKNFVRPPVSACRTAVGRTGLRCCNVKRAMTLL